MKSILLWLELQNKLIFFCLKISRYIRSSAFLYVSLAAFLAYHHYYASKQTLPVWKNINFFCSCYFLVQFEVIVRSKTSQLYHTAERMVWFKCRTCSLNAYSLKASSHSRQNMEVVSQPFKLGWPLRFQIVLFGQVLHVLEHIPEGSVA